MKKIKKAITILTLGTMLCGGTLTVSAACGHSNGAHSVWSYTTREAAGSHMYGTGQVCQLTKVTDYYNVVCNDCGSTISTYSSSYTGHSVVH